MLVHKKFKLILSILLVLLLSSTVFATNGYFRHGYGIQYSALAGAGIALPLSPLGTAMNPAGILYLQRQLDVEVSLFNPNREYTITGAPSGMPFTFPLTPGTIESESRLFAIPSFGYSHPINAQNVLGIVVYGNGGMNTDYDTKTFDNPQLDFNAPTGVNLSQLFAVGTYARQIVPDHAIGISGIFAYQMFEAQGLNAFGSFSMDPTKLSNNENSTSSGFGFRIGYMGKIGELFSVGASYQSKINMSEFEEYAGLFAEAGDFDIPANWAAGIAFKATPKLTFVADVEQIFYSDIPAVGNSMDLTANAPFVMVDPNDPTMGMMPNENFVPLGGEGELAWGFGWEDITVVKLGAQFEALKGTMVRAGFSTGGQPISDSNVMFNILAPGVIENHVTIGFSHQLSGKLTLNGGFMHGFSKSVSGANPFEVPGQQQIEIKMNQFEGDLGVSINL